MPRNIVDYRLGGEPICRIVPDNWEGFVRLPDEVLKCVVFLGSKKMDPKTGKTHDALWGTAFFLALPIDASRELICLVTARHVADKINEGQFFVRANLKDGTAKNIWLDAGADAHWISHPTDDSEDASVMVWAPPREVDFLCIPKIMFLDDGGIAQKNIGVGDEVHVTGLFSFHSGRERIEPIVRSGHIAMMPLERIPVPDWNSDGIEGCLIECRSLGGLSGSPVFVMRSIEVQPTEDTGRKPLATGAGFLLGLMHGHWDPSTQQVDIVQRLNDQHHPEKRINSGVSIVVPCAKIMEIMQHPAITIALDAARSAQELSAVMDVKKAKAVTISIVTSLGTSFRQSPPRLDTTDGVALSDANPDHKADLKRLLSAALKKPKSDD